MRPTTLQRLQVFRAVYEEETVSAAARRLKLAQPTVSRHLRDFESALGLLLFSLNRSRLTPTREADALYADSEFLNEGLTRLESRISALQKGSESHLMISAIGLLIPEVVAPSVAGLLKRFPELNVSIDAATATQQIDALQRGKIDLGIVAGKINANGINRYHIGSARLVALVPDEDPASQMPSISLKSISGSRALVRMAARSPIGRILNKALEQHDLSYGEQVTGYSILAVSQIAQALRMMCVVDEFTARYARPAGMTVVPLEEDLGFDVQVISLSEAGSVKSDKNQFIEILRTNLAKSQSAP